MIRNDINFLDITRDTEILPGMYSLRLQVDLYKSPLGSRPYPARTCRELKEFHPHLKNGEFWIDPNGGPSFDAVRALCDFRYNATCLLPFTAKTENKKWFQGSEVYKWFGRELSDPKPFAYAADATQITFLQLLSERAVQNITYHCRNSAAWYDQQTSDYSRGVKLLADNGVQMHARSSKKFKPTVVKDECMIKDGKWRKAIFEIDTPKTQRLPLHDIAIYVTGDKREEFGLEVGPVCFM